LERADEADLTSMLNLELGQAVGDANRYDDNAQLVAGGVDGEEGIEDKKEKSHDMANSGVEKGGKYGDDDYEAHNERLRNANSHKGEEKHYVNALIRIEDTLRPEMNVKRQLVGSMRLALNRVYSFKAGFYHMLLEDQFGGEVLDHYNSVEFKRNSTYVAMRVGLPYHQDWRDKNFYYIDGQTRDKKKKDDLKSYYWAYPQKLLMFEIPGDDVGGTEAQRDATIIYPSGRMETDSDVMPLSFGMVLLGTLVFFILGGIVWLLSFRALERGMKRDSRYFGFSDRVEEVDERAIGA